MTAPSAVSAGRGRAQVLARALALPPVPRVCSVRQERAVDQAAWGGARFGGAAGPGESWEGHPLKPPRMVPSPTLASCPQWEWQRPPRALWGAACLPQAARPAPPSPGTPRPWVFAPSEPEPEGLLPSKGSAGYREPTHPQGRPSGVPGAPGCQVLEAPSSLEVFQSLPGPQPGDSRAELRGNSAQEGGKGPPAQQVPGLLDPAPGRVLLSLMSP